MSGEPSCYNFQEHGNIVRMRRVKSWTERKWDTQAQRYMTKRVIVFRCPKCGNSTTIVV